MSDDSTGVCYLLHFSRPYKHAAHYLGWTENLEQRLAAHRHGNGARLMAVIAEAGIDWECVRTWPGDRALERRFKRWHKSPQLCPICNPRRGDANHGHQDNED